MAIINKIRQRAGLAVGVIAIGIGGFVLQDLLFGQSRLFGDNTQIVGEISGNEIKLQDFQQQVDEFKNNYLLNTGKNPDENEMPGIREQAWNQLIFKISYLDQFNKLGLRVTEEEVVDIVQGANIHPSLRQIFVNPETNQFDRNLIINYLQNLGQLEPQQQAMWYVFERNIGPERLRTKYENLLGLSNYATTHESKNFYNEQNARAEVKFIYVPFYSIYDTTVHVAEHQLKEYLEENQDQYQVDETGSIEYVVFPIILSAKDSAYFYEEINDLKSSFALAEDDSAFVSLNSDLSYNPDSMHIGDMPEKLQNNPAILQKDTVLGPFADESSYILYKIEDILEDSIYYARASHILFKTKSESDEDKAEALRECENVLKQIKQGGSFEELANIHGSDATSTRGGDLGWFDDGTMVAPFNEAVFKSEKLGLLPEPVETRFGYHIIKITELKTNKLFKVATVEREIYASDETRNAVYVKADFFSGTSKNLSEFYLNIENDTSITSDLAENVGKTDQHLNNMLNVREVIRWAFKDAEVEDVSQVFEFEDKIIVAAVIEKQDEGTAQIDKVRDEITVKVRNKLKGEQMMEKLIASSGSIDQIAEQYGSDALVKTAGNVNFQSNYLEGVGNDVIAIGKIFALKEGERTEPFVGETGVLLIELVKLTPAAETQDFNSYKSQLINKRSSSSQYYINESIRDFAEIEDNRSRFY
ncbi:MAG: peptidylprolyl isomerase [Cytophagales bacterium]|nr:peptidylprolyl isomerase [Cytophagales bacterium]